MLQSSNSTIPPSISICWKKARSRVGDTPCTLLSPFFLSSSVVSYPALSAFFPPREKARFSSSVSPSLRAPSVRPSVRRYATNLIILYRAASSRLFKFKSCCSRAPGVDVLTTPLVYPRPTVINSSARIFNSAPVVATWNRGWAAKESFVATSRLVKSYAT